MGSLLDYLLGKKPSLVCSVLVNTKNITQVSHHGHMCKEDLLVSPERLLSFVRGEAEPLPGLPPGTAPGALSGCWQRPLLAEQLHKALGCQGAKGEAKAQRRVAAGLRVLPLAATPGQGFHPELQLPDSKDPEARGGVGKERAGWVKRQLTAQKAPRKPAQPRVARLQGTLQQKQTLART